MRKLLAGMACLAAVTIPAGVVLDNARVRVFRAGPPLVLADHPAAVVVPLEDGATRKAGEAYWSGDPALEQRPGARDTRAFILVEPKDTLPSPLAEAKPTPAGSKPGEGVFTGMSFQPLFENDRVMVIRGRMEVGAREGFHTHASDIVIVHLSGGTIEDTAAGTTKLNRWKPGDVEFEARGSSHSARNVGPAIEAVLVTLKP